MADSLLIPKDETQASEFVNKYPQYDGRGIVIAILDTGIDPGAPGLSITTDGKPKIIDCIDVTGSGDVDISTKKVASPETNTIEGLSGRTLQIPTDWDCPSKEFYVGIKVINQLLPSTLRDRCDRDWRSKVWNKEVDRFIAETQLYLDFHSKSTDKENQEYKDKNDELNSRLGVLKEISKWKYPGLICDCIVWKNSQNKWRAVIDTTEGKNLSSLKVMGSYRDTFEYNTFSSLDMFNYSLDIYPERKILVIVCNSGSHATHVAAIAAGNWPANGAVGVAPGAQLISIKIGDTRLGSMETGVAFLRAINICMERKVNLINYSYGEAAASGNCGPLIEAINEAVISHGIIFVSSAGNEGPALCTVGAPGGTCTSIIGVGAFVTSSMMKSSYAFHNDQQFEQPFTWSSRGPTFDGWIGPTICAPGGAITSVPNWTLNQMQLMSGTSMSSPNACGCCALILSGLQMLNIEWSPFHIKRALVSTAKSTNFDVWSVGAGLIQVNNAFEYCRANRKFIGMGFNINVNTGRGILIRTCGYVDKQEKSYDITIRPVFIQANEIPTIDGQQSLIQFRLPLDISSSVSWISCPSKLQVSNSPRTFMVKINQEALALPDNSVHFGKILLTSTLDDLVYDYIPVTYIKPKRVTFSGRYLKLGRFQLTAGQLCRNFLKLDFECKRATIVLRNEQLNVVECPSVFVVHTNFHNADQPFTAASTKKIVKLFPGQSSEISFEVDSKHILEICIGKFWNSTSDPSSVLSAFVIWSPVICTNLEAWLPSSSICTPVRLQLAFDPKKLDDEIETLDITNSKNLHNDEYNNLCSSLKLPGVASNGDVQLSVEWTSWSMPLRPSDTQIQLVSTLYNKKNIFRRVFTYKFSTCAKYDVTVSIPVMQDILYDCPFISQMWMLFDSQKQYYSSGDALARSFTKLPKGDYFIFLQLVHEKIEILDQFKDFSINVVFKLSNGSIPPVDIFRTARSAVVFKHKSNKIRLTYGRTEPIYLGRISEEKYPKGIYVGCCIHGMLSISAADSTFKQPLMPIKYIVVDKSKKVSDNISPIQQANPDPTDIYRLALRDLKIQWIPKLSDESIINEILTETDEYLPSHLNNLERLCKMKDPNIDNIRVAYEKIKTLIDQNQLAKSLISKSGDKSEAAKLKNTLLEAFTHMGKILISTKPENWLALADELYKDTISWIEFDDNKVSSWTLEYFVAKGMYGKALTMIFADKSNLPDKRATELFRSLSWDYIADVHSKLIMIKYPNEYLLL